MSLSAFTDWTGSAIIGHLVSLVFPYIIEHMLPADTEAELNRLNSLLPKITAVMKVAEALKMKHPNSGVDAWLQQFNLAFLAAEDVLDELKYLELEEMVKDREQMGTIFPSLFGSRKRKSPSSNISNAMLGRLREAVRLLDHASKDVAHFDKLVAGLGLCEADKVSSRETSCILTENSVVGRETEKATIIEWLKKPAPHTVISAFCIVGAGGLGKTTLAQVINDEMNRENLFDNIIWACVSTIFSVEDITRKILKQLDEKSDIGESLDDIQKKLKQKVHSKKVLLILDDVWNEDEMCGWQKLVAPLRFVQQGSKILLTTRMKSVADMLACVLNVEREYLDLRGLEEQQLLLLMNNYAFHGYNPDNHKELQKIGNEIVKKLWGSPLAAKVIGSLLNSNMESYFWKRILKCNSLIDLEQAKKVTDVLKLSYYHLSADLQQCFRFCSIFPQDHLIEKNRLIKMWVASGFIRQQSGLEERPEDIGEEYFNHLLRKSFFEQRNGYDGEKNYILHDLMHELARNVSKGECFRADPNSKLIDIPSTAKHVSLPDYEIERIFHLRNLRTLIITMPPWNEMPSWYDMHAYKDRFVFSHGLLKETLRVLIIDVKRSYELPKEIDRLVHLRFLKVNVGSGSLISNSIYKLYHLQVLELFRGMHVNTDYSGVETIGMANLVSLRYIHLPDEMMKNIRGVHTLTSLQELTFFVGHDSGRHIDELKTLDNLQNLSIEKIENVGDPAQAKNANLSGKKSLLTLSLNWTEGNNSHNHEQIIDNLQPHPNLRELDIEHYKGHRSPIWMRDLPPPNLSSLKLSNCHLWNDLLFAQMPLLKKLSLLEMSEVKELGYSFDSNRSAACAFPSLEQLKCERMPKWQSWSRSPNCHGFPNLKELTITDCPNLADLPAMPLSLSSFRMSNVGLYSLPDLYYSSSGTADPALSSPRSSLRVVRISTCPNLKSLNGFLQQENIDFQAIEELIIHSCENLIQLPACAFGNLVSLTYLDIHGCPKLVSVDNQRILLPVNLQTLKIGDCGELDVKLLDSASQLTELANLYIENSITITCIPCSQNAFASLDLLHIQGCEKLVPQTLMEIAQDGNPGNRMESLKINFIDISHLSLLSIEPLRRLRFVSTCRVRNCYEMEALPEQWLMQNSSTLKQLNIENASTLRSLPDIIVNLTALEQLSIKNATLLEQIPDLPPSLVELTIENASSLSSLPDTMVRLTALKQLNIENATLLKHVPYLPPSLLKRSITGASGFPLV
ncbi:hypothetical protein LUZ61_012962 [Rhynchospora tenuis]|uniref:Uncharacterized protein n=1 Tax=Rhynchospora tenuis TaxID=198213 RepID=A0AAD6F1L7_9POAL|nr:hypothetical protein LUZ61_012962 [Rhynchospora tenuis]